jgi:hypothetical protein
MGKDDTMANWRDELRAISRRDPDPGDEIVSLSEAMHTGESDRGCVLISGSLAENCLQQIIRVRATQLTDNKLEELFGFEAPLGTFSAKIKVAYAFSMIDADIRSDLDRIREIRNAFAHSRVLLSFKTPCVERACAGFIAPTPEAIRKLLESLETHRSRFVDACVAISTLATLAMNAAARKNARRSPPPLTYAGVRTYRDKLWQQLPRRNQANPRSDGRKTSG